MAKKKLPKHVIIKEGKWFVRRSFPTPERYANGNIRYIQVVRLCNPETEERAKEISDGIMAAMSGAVRFDEAITLNDHLDHFLRAKSTAVATRTYTDYSDLRKRYVKNLGSRELASITTFDLQTHYAGIKSAVMVGKLNTLVSMAFNQAIKWKLITDNPCRGVILPKGAHKEVEIMERSEARKFGAYCRKHDRYLVLAFALETAMRPGEYLGLRWKDLDLIKGTATIRQAVSYGKSGGWHYKPPKTRGSRRTIHLSAEMCELLKKHREIQHARIKKLERDIAKPLLIAMGRKGVNYEKRKAIRAHKRERLKIFKQHDLVFPSAKGTPLSPTSLGRFQMREACKNVGIESHSLYSLRHTAASWLLAEGVNPRVVADLLGHSGIVTLLKTYSHVLPSMSADATQKLASVLYD